MSSIEVYRRLLTYVWPYRYSFFLAIFGNILYGAVDAGMIKFLESLLDEGFVKHKSDFIAWVPIIVIGIFIVRGMATFLSTFFMGWVGRNVVKNIREEMFGHLLRLPTSYYDKTPSGEILSKITYNVEQVADASSDAFTVLVRETCTIIGLLVVMLTTSWRLVCLFLIIGPIMAFIMNRSSKRMRKISGTVQSSMGDLAHVTEEAIEGAKVIKAFGGHDYESQRFHEATFNNRRQEMKLIATSALNVPLIQLVGSVALAMTIYLATLSPDHFLGTAISPGAFAGMMTAMILLLKPINQLTKVNSNIQKGLAGAISIFQFLDEKSEPDTGTTTLAEIQGAITFEKVCFYYHPDKQTLDNISFSVQKGEKVAIVGRSGGGKSTLVNLLPRFYEGTGEVKIDGVNIKTIPLQSLRQMIAVVTQQVTLFNDTIANNIAYGRQNATLDSIMQAAKSAYAHEFIENLPQGYNTLIGENGLRLSGGQRQRLAIARAIFKNAPILILDEATSALDTESERYIQAALEALMRNATTLIIAHRLSTIEKADRILVIEQGKLVEVGTHQALILLGGTYANLREVDVA